MQLGTCVLNLVLIFSLLGQFSGSVSESSSSTPQAPICSEEDRASLLSFKAGISQDTSQTLSTWTGRDCCDGGWEGVQCNPSTGRVNMLQIQRPERDDETFMKGTLSPSLGNLHFLEVMIISGMKHITGPIPNSFSNLTHLTQLILDDNSVGGCIPPSLGRLSLLQSLSLAGNHLKGQIPPTFGGLRNLVQLNLARNSLSGPIPLSLKTVINLQYLDLSYNLLSAPIPDFIGELKNLTYVDLSSNLLTGKIPVSLFGLVNLLDLSLSNNKLTGNIPDQVGNLKSLTSLQLSANLLTGHIPLSISRLQNLWYLNVSSNWLSDPLPVIPTKGIPSLLSIDLSYNNLSLGTVPDWIRSKQLKDVHLAGCKLKGNLPHFTRPDSLSSIDLSDNYLVDGISNFFTNMSGLQKLKLSNNQLRFDISAIKLPTELSSIDLHANLLVGSLSTIVNNRTSSSLEVIDLSNNFISGHVPGFVEGSSLKVLNVGSNNITGPIPVSISNLVYLERLDISRNHVLGTIPSSLGQTDCVVKYHKPDHSTSFDRLLTATTCAYVANLYNHARNTEAWVSEMLTLSYYI
ncbi:hypothetical protein VIGAN_08014300 [Vigna angularis var. angularis]|uniref:Leucine-rich repeat-containing N-terminal plant-type domain-containing protein n=1 Tax=Vigna angularis var. angularis TaxID=157739 RepID=A0A0S3SLE7_PHAAN|nr:receptor-like protein 12 [Vigna angularis]BAT93624.1 hypothetical protein VIGAN_08014300 [Vigna angularis var. angularis]